MVEELSEEMQVWLETIAETCLAHMKHVESLEEGQVSVDDEGLVNLETAFLTVYALLKKGGLPPVPANKLN